MFMYKYCLLFVLFKIRYEVPIALAINNNNSLILIPGIKNFNDLVSNG